jgi:SAM-dependent methyltransferase
MSDKICFLCGCDNIQLLSYNNIFIDKCSSCGFQYIPNNEKYIGKDYYSQYFIRRYTKENSKLNELRKRQYKIDVIYMTKYMNHSTRILDVGCSSGVFMSEIYKINRSKYLTGIDVDSSAIKEAICHFSGIADFRNINLLEIDRKYDLIIFRGTFQYLDKDLHRSIVHLKDILDHNGKIIIYSLPSTDSFVYHLLQDKWALFHPEMSLMFNENSIRYLCEKYKLNIEDLSYPYLEDVYANPEDDYKHIQQIISGDSMKSPPFWGGIMRVVLQVIH